MTNNVAVFFTSASGSEKFADAKLNFLRPDDDVANGQPHAPMLVRWPGNIPAGRVSNLPWSAQDFAPTALQIAYARPAKDVTGISILPVLFGEPGTNTPALPDREQP
jgi:arylsulfatase A-like enzyme